MTTLPPKEQIIEEMAEAIYKCDRVMSGGEYIDGFQVSPTTWHEYNEIVKCYPQHHAYLKKQAQAALTALVRMLPEVEYTYVHEHFLPVNPPPGALLGIKGDETNRIIRPIAMFNFEGSKCTFEEANQIAQALQALRNLKEMGE